MAPTIFSGCCVGCGAHITLHDPIAPFLNCTTMIVSVSGIYLHSYLFYKCSNLKEESRRTLSGVSRRGHRRLLHAEFGCSTHRVQGNLGHDVTKGDIFLDDEVENMKTHCPYCDGDRRCDIKATYKTEWETGASQDLIFGGSTHRILECRGCERVFYYQENWNSENEEVVVDDTGNDDHIPLIDVETFPPKSQPVVDVKPDWLPRLQDIQLKRLLKELYLAYEHGSFVLTAVGMRTCLDRVTELYQIDPAITFEEKLDELRKLGLIGDNERSILDLIVNAGNAAAHRGWRPDQDETGKMLTAFEAFLLRCFILHFDAKSIAAAIPPKPKRRAKKSPAPK